MRLLSSKFISQIESELWVLSRYDSRFKDEVSTAIPGTLTDIFFEMDVAGRMQCGLYDFR